MDHIRLYAPPGLEPEDRYWGTGERPARIFYVVDRLVATPYDQWRDFVTVHSQTIRKIIGSEAGERGAKVKLDAFIEVDHRYIVDNHSKGYRLRDEWLREPVVEHVIRCPRFAEKIRNLDRDVLSNLGRVERTVYYDIQLLNCAIGDVNQFLAELPPKPGTKDEQHRKTIYRAAISTLLDRSYRIVGRTSYGRFYHPVTRTPKRVREHLLLAGEKTCEVDLSNSQPFFMATIFKGVAGLAQSVSAGRFYGDINSRLGVPVDLNDSDAKGTLKKAVLSGIYAKPADRWKWAQNEASFVTKVWAAMDLTFPGLCFAITEFARLYGDTALAREMQQRESAVVIDQVLPELQRRGIPAIPIHDSFLCREVDRAEVMNLFIESLYSSTGIYPTVR